MIKQANFSINDLKVGDIILYKDFDYKELILSIDISGFGTVTLDNFTPMYIHFSEIENIKKLSK